MSRSPKKLAPKPVLERARKAPPKATAEKVPAGREERVVVGDYLVLACPACGKDVKLKSAYAGRRMGCGFCKAPLEIIEQPEEVEEKRKRRSDEKPIVRQPLMFRRLRDEDIADESELEFTDEYERRRLPFESPLWDDEEGGEHSPKKKLLTHKEEVFRNITYIIMAASLAVVAVIVYSASVRMIGVAHRDDKTLGELPADVRRKIEAVTSQESPISMFLGSEEEVAALAIVNGFVNAESIEARLPFVRDPERVKPLMEEWYAREKLDTDWPDGEIVLRDKVVDGGRYFIRLAINFVGIGNKMFAVEQTRDSFKLDWETASGYQPMPIAEFEVARPKQAVEFRVKLKPSDYYNFHFSDKEKYRAVELSYPGKDEFRLIGYFDRSQPWAIRLEAMLDGGSAPSLIVTLKYPDEIGEGEDLDQVQIMSIVAESWWR